MPYIAGVILQNSRINYALRHSKMHVQNYVFVYRMGGIRKRDEQLHSDWSYQSRLLLSAPVLNAIFFPSSKIVPNIYCSRSSLLLETLCSVLLIHLQVYRPRLAPYTTASNSPLILPIKFSRCCFSSSRSEKLVTCLFHRLE